MNARQVFVKSVCCTLAFLTVGCATERSSRTAGGRAAAAYENELNREWAGKPYTALLEAFGEPPMVMNIPSSGMNAAVVVYPVIEKLPAKCTHAFTIQRGADPKVMKYACQ